MKLIAFFILATLSCAYSWNGFPEEWNMFKADHGKTYKNLFEEQFRMKVFMENKIKIVKHNRKHDLGLVSYRLKMNHFGDLMSHEFAALMNGFNKSSNSNIREKNSVSFIEPLNIDVPTEIDWRQKGAVTPVKNQGSCGSCWAFSSTGSLEGQLFRKTGKLVSLSEQNLVDCSTSYGNNGCDGGLMDQAFQYIEDNKGIDLESSYPYEAQDGECRYTPTKVGGTDKGYVDIPKDNEDALKVAISTYGPISVAIDASHSSFQFYAGGIYDEPECSSVALDHGVLAVGYGTEQGKDFWLVKNSWGESWGDQGYIHMIRNKNNQCGIASMASYPLV